LVIGCSDDSISINASSSNFCSQIADVACHNIYQCCTESEIERYLGVTDPRTEDQCRDDVTRSCTRDTATLDDSLKAKRVTFDSSKMNACLTAVLAPGGTCSEVVTELPWKVACMDSAFVGQVSTGDACFFDFDCQGAPDSFCAPNQKCAAKPVAGFPCGTGCASNYFCSSGLCAARVAAGGPCTSNLQCAMDLFCDLSATPMPICTAAQPGGATCTSNQACMSGDCVPGQCMGTTFTCYKDTDCESHCANTGNFCTTASNCALGNCSVGGNSCSSDVSCTAGSGDHCVFPVQCLPGSCVGEPVCTAQTLTVDFCTSVNQLPVL
jgi:hypothetical protein